MIIHNVTRFEGIERYSFIGQIFLFYVYKITILTSQIVNMGTLPLCFYFIVSHSFLHIYQSSLTLAAALLLLNMKWFLMPFLKAGSPAELPVCPYAHLVFVILVS